MQGVCSQDGRDGSGGLRPGQETKALQALPGIQFRSVHQALAWAYRVVERSGAKVASYGPMLAAVTGAHLSRFDIIAQASMIQAAVRDLPEHERWYVLAAYSWSLDGHRAIESLCRLSAVACPCDTPRMVEALVIRHIRAARRMGCESTRTIALIHGVGRQVVRAREEKVRVWLSGLWTMAESDLLRQWESGSLISP